MNYSSVPLLVLVLAVGIHMVLSLRNSRVLEMGWLQIRERRDSVTSELGSTASVDRRPTVDRQVFWGGLLHNYREVKHVKRYEQLN